MYYDIAPYRIGDMLSEAWRLTRENFAILIGINSVAVLLGYIVQRFSPDSIWPTIISFLLAPISLGVTIKVLLDSVRDNTPTIQSAFEFAGPRYLKIMMTSILYLVMVLLGLCLLIVPGIYIAIRFWFATTVATLEPVSIMQSFKRAGAVAEGHMGRLIGLNLLAGILWSAIIIAVSVVGGSLSTWMGQYPLIHEITGISTMLVAIIATALFQALVVVAYFALQSSHDDVNNDILAELRG